MWTPGDWVPNTFTIICGEKGSGKNSLLKHIFLQNHDKVDYTVLFSRNAEEHRCIEPKIQINKLDLSRLRKIMTFQKQHRKRYKLLIIFENICPVFYSSTVSELIMDFRNLGISIIFVQNSGYIPSFLRFHAHNFFVTPRLVLQFESSFVYPTDKQNGFFFFKASERPLWIDRAKMRFIDKPKRPNTFLNPCIYNFLVKQSRTANKDHLNQLLKNYVDREKARLYARSWIARHTPNMSKLQFFFKCYPGLLKFIGGKLLSSVYYHRPTKYN